MAAQKCNGGGSTATRLERELSDLERDPVPCVGVAVIDARTWHANLFRPSGEPSGGGAGSAADVAAPLHVEIAFPGDYPLSAPTCRVFHAVESLHVQRHPEQPGGSTFRVCLDMLEDQLPGGTVAPFHGWSPAMRIKGLLVQLQATLMSLTEAVTGADTRRAQTCSLCGHAGTASEPGRGSIRRNANTASAGARRRKDTHSSDGFLNDELYALPAIVPVTVFGDAPFEKHARHGSEDFTSISKENKGSGGAAATSAAATATSALGKEDNVGGGSGGGAGAGAATGAATATTLVLGEDNGGWITVSVSKSSRRSSSSYAPMKATVTACVLVPNRRAMAQTSAQNYHVLKTHTLVRPGEVKLTKTKLKNQRRNARRRLERLKALEDGEAGSGAAGSAGAKTAATSAQAPTALASTLTGSHGITDLATDAVARPLVRGSPLERTPRHVLTELVGFVGLVEVRALLCTSKRCSKQVNDSWVWRGLFIQHDALYHQTGSMPSVRASSNWRRSFDLHFDTCVASNLKCFVTLSTVHDDVLGFPLDFTRNPRTRRTDYVGLHADSVMSKTAFHELGHRRSIWSEKAIALLPMFLTDEHFRRALPSIRRTIAGIAGLARSDGLAKSASFVPIMVLDVIPQAMKTLSLQIANNGVAASSRTADAYVQLHRLFVAMIQEYPSLRKEIHHRLRTFIKGGEKNRCKEACPSLGDLFPLLTVCREYRYEHLVRPFFLEQIDRGALWTCRDFPQLANTSLRVVGRGADSDVLKSNWEAQLLGNRLMLINRAVLELLRPSSSLSQCCMRHDYLLGHATPPAKAKFVASIKRALAVDKWGEWLALAGVVMAHGAPPSPARLTDWLKQAIANSERRGYHKRGMNFSKVHRSGGSRLMQRGDKCELGHLGQVELRDTWRFVGPCKYLDASVLLFDFEGKYTGTAVDYNNTSTRGIRHSGDVIDHMENKGTHTVKCRMRRLDRNVGSLVVVLSAFDEATLDEILSPCVIVSDTSTGVELCRYELDARRSETSGCKCVVMCRLHRQTHGGAWQVEAIGRVQAFGDAMDYSPIVLPLERRLKEKKDAQRQFGGGGGAAPASASDGKVDEHRQFQGDRTW